MEEEVLSKLPITSLRRVRFTCKRWNNTLSKDWSFTRKYKGEAAKRKEFQVVMMLEYKVYLMSVNLLNPSPSIERIERTRLVVWNPFNGQIRWIQSRDSYHRCDSSWKVVDVNPDWHIHHYYRGLSLKAVGPNAVSWNKVFLAVDMRPLIGFQFQCLAGSFFVDEKKKVVVVIDMTRGHYLTIRNMAYVLSENGYLKTVDLGELANGNCWPLVCSYVPSSVRINQAAPPGNQRNTSPYLI
ncbi:unnamed protein product [Brassica napus]|uniref:(rape) hypothetical protein n=1 Tax=Brassica napus TaxID=3708 RepID=A0A816RPS1_BRANA|nr:unnamed protein product [Brassica napus]